MCKPSLMLNWDSFQFHTLSCNKCHYNANTIADEFEFVCAWGSMLVKSWQESLFACYLWDCYPSSAAGPSRCRRRRQHHFFQPGFHPSTVGDECTNEEPDSESHDPPQHHLSLSVSHRIFLINCGWHFMSGEERRGGSCCTVDIGAPYMPCWLTVVCCLQGMPDRMLCAVLEQFQLYFSRWYVCFVFVWVCPYMTVEHENGFFFIYFNLNLFYFVSFIYTHTFMSYLLLSVNLCVDMVKIESDLCDR